MLLGCALVGFILVALVVLFVLHEINEAETVENEVL